MTRSELYELVTKVISDTFAYPQDGLSEDTVAEDVDGWDSLKHTILMVRLQRAVGVTFPESIAEAGNVAELVDRIHALL